MRERKPSSSCLASLTYRNPSLACNPLSGHTTPLTVDFLLFSLMHCPELAHVPVICDACSGAQVAGRVQRQQSRLSAEMQ